MMGLGQSAGPTLTFICWARCLRQSKTETWLNVLVSATLERAMILMIMAGSIVSPFSSPDNHPAAYL